MVMSSVYPLVFSVTVQTYDLPQLHSFHQQPDDHIT